MEHTIIMLPAQEEKIRKIFASAKSFAVVSGDETAEETLLAKEALVAGIRNTGLSVRSYPERQKKFAEKWVAVLPTASDAPAVFSTSILLPKNKIEIHEVSYTEDSRYVSININANDEISKENAVFKTLPAKVDAVFCFGELPEGLSQKIATPEQDKVVAVSTPPDGETMSRHEGASSFLSRSAPNETMSQKIFNIIQLIESSEDVSATNTPVPDLLLASLLAETDQFQKNTNEESLGLASSLIKLGADKEKIAGILNDKSPAFARLLGRALARSYPNESLKSMWTFVATQDLEKTGNEPSFALFVKIMRKIKNILDSRPFFVLIWQSKQEIWAMVSAKSPGGELEEKIKTALSATKEEGNLISGPYKNFSEAELKIQNMLKEAI